MPTLDKRTSKHRWKGVVTIHGKRQEQRFPDDSTESYHAAVSWEQAIKKAALTAQTRTATVLLTCLEWLNEYLDFSSESQAKATFEEKRATAKRVATFLGQNTLVSELDPQRVMRFLREQNRNRSGYAANRDRKNLAAAWTWGRKYLAGFPSHSNPFSDIDRFSEKRSPRYIPPEADFWKVFEQADGQDRVMLLAFLHLAARKGEVFRLRVEDLDFENMSAALWTSKREGGNTECDQVPMTETLARALKQWLEVRPVASPYVFINLGEEQFCRDLYGQPFVSRQHFMGKLCEKAKVKPFSYHAIRHLSASILYREGQTVSAIQVILRHKSPATTTRYLHSLGHRESREALGTVMNSRGSYAVNSAS